MLVFEIIGITAVTIIAIVLIDKVFRYFVPKNIIDEEKEQLKAIAEKKRIERLKQQGVNEYFYGHNVIYARNQKNANRKARNNGYL